MVGRGYNAAIRPSVRQFCLSHSLGDRLPASDCENIDSPHDTVFTNSNRPKLCRVAVS